jgi:hypothetical protein
LWLHCSVVLPPPGAGVPVGGVVRGLLFRNRIVDAAHLANPGVPEAGHRVVLCV